MDLLKKYLPECSPYIMEFTYNLEEREVLVTCAKSISDWQPCKTLKFTDVIGFTEDTFEDLTDDDYTDSIIGLHEIKNGYYCLHTEKRELIINTISSPIAEVVEEKA